LTGTLYTLGDRDGLYDLLGLVVQRWAGGRRGGTVGHESRDSWASVYRGGTLGQWVSGPVWSCCQRARPCNAAGRASRAKDGTVSRESAWGGKLPAYILPKPPRQWSTYEVVWPGSLSYSRTGLSAQRDTVFPAPDGSEGSSRFPSIKLGLGRATPAPINACATSLVGPGVTVYKHLLPHHPVWTTNG
jgi:hypothetical protein